MSNRDKSLIIGLLVVIVILVYYFVPYKMMKANIDTLTTEVTELENTYDILKVDINKESEYREELEVFDKENSQIAAMLPQELTQERIIYIINDLENYLEVDMPSVSLGTEEKTTYLYEDNAMEGQEIALKNAISTSIVCTYKQLKSLLNYVNTNEDKMVIKNLTMDSGGETGELNVSYIIEFYGLNIEGRESEVIDLGDYDIGKNSVFEGFDGYSGGTAASPLSSGGQTQDEDSDFYLFLDPLASDRSTVTIGKTVDPSSSTQAYYDENAVTYVEFIFTQSDGVYYYKYKAGEDTYPNDYSTPVAFDPGSALEIQVFSEDRVDTNDLSGVNATIINETDIPVNIIYFSEDFSNPRFTLGYTEGDVIVH